MPLRPRLRSDSLVVLGVGVVRQKESDNASEAWQQYDSHRHFLNIRDVLDQYPSYRVKPPYVHTTPAHRPSLRLLQGAVPELAQLPGDDLIALVVGVNPILADVPLVQVNLGEGYVIIACRRGDVAVDFV